MPNKEGGVLQAEGQHEQRQRRQHSWCFCGVVGDHEKGLPHHLLFRYHSGIKQTNTVPQSSLPHHPAKVRLGLGWPTIPTHLPSGLDNFLLPCTYLLTSWLLVGLVFSNTKNTYSIKQKRHKMSEIPTYIFVVSLSLG